MSEQYPFKCDFYIKKYDLYIEIQGTWHHGKHPFNENDVNDIKLLEKWKEESLIKSQYKRAINIWVIKDPMKRKIVKDNKLNWIEVFSNESNDVIKKYINTISKYK